MKGWAPGLALKKRPKVIRKWPIRVFRLRHTRSLPLIMSTLSCGQSIAWYSFMTSQGYVLLQKIWLKREWSHLAGDVGRQASQYSICISMVYPTLLWSTSLYIWETRLFILSTWYGQVLTPCRIFNDVRNALQQFHMYFYSLSNCGQLDRLYG